MFASPQDWLMVGLVGFVLFGSKRMPEIAKTLGSSIVEFKKAMSTAMEEGTQAANPTEAAPAAPAPAPAQAAAPAPVPAAPPPAPTPAPDPALAQAAALRGPVAAVPAAETPVAPAPPATPPA